jgi:DNA processing protein
MLSEEERYYRIALTLVPQVGPKRAKAILDRYGSARAAFVDDNPGLVCDFAAVDRTVAFTRKHGIRVLCPCDPEYPSRLKLCADPPSVLYYKGAADLNPAHVLSIVGTRTPSPYGQQVVRTLIEGLAPFGVLVVSGLADGIDTLSHRYALDNGLPTVGILGHGLQMIYPARNRLLARAMLERGGLLTEFREDAGPETFNFPRRNRVVAGIPEATVIIESGIRGGSMVTAKLAGGYNREVFAIPGRITDERSQGCLALIRDNAAALVTGAGDIARMLGWEQRTPQPRPEIRTHPLLDLLRDRDSVHVDELRARSGLSATELALALLTLELERTIEVLPGTRYRLMS